MGKKRKLADLLKRAKGRKMTATEREAQRQDFAFGNAMLSNPNITRKDVHLAAEALKRQHRLA